MASVANSPSRPLPAIATLAWRELARFFRQRNRVIGAFGQPIIFWLLFSEGFRSVSLGYAYQFPGILAMILLFTAIFTTISIIEDRNEGFLQGVLVAPVPRWAMVMGKILGGATIAWLQAVLFFLLGCLTVKEVDPSLVNVVAALALMFVIAFALTGLGFVLAWQTDSSQGYHAMMSLLLFPMWLLSGAFFTIARNSPMWYVVVVNPLTYGVAGLRHLLTGPGTVGETWLPSLEVSWGVSLLFAAIMVAASVWITRVRTAGDFK
jgi:ABC-2 type transport system permease protein